MQQLRLDFFFPFLFFSLRGMGVVGRAGGGKCLFLHRHEVGFGKRSARLD